jgi:glutamine amidotransferase
MERLTMAGFGDALRDFHLKERPLIGICLGMQMLFERGTEFGVTEGLGLLKGEVRSLIEEPNWRDELRLPHIGWSALRKCRSHPLVDKMREDSEYYFVHSYVARPRELDLLATTDYNGVTVVSMVGSGNLVGCQFHPEKSGRSGLSLLKTFTEM